MGSVVVQNFRSPLQLLQVTEEFVSSWNGLDIWFGSLFIVFLLPCFLVLSWSLVLFGFWFPFLLHSLSKGISSTIMSCFLHDFAIGQGGSVSEGSIEQPIMDSEVISISGSSFEDTCWGAFDSESSSSERVRASHRASGGASPLEEGCDIPLLPRSLSRLLWSSPFCF